MPFAGLLRGKLDGADDPDRPALLDYQLLRVNRYAPTFRADWMPLSAYRTDAAFLVQPKLLAAADATLESLRRRLQV